MFTVRCFLLLLLIYIYICTHAPLGSSAYVLLDMQPGNLYVHKPCRPLQRITLAPGPAVLPIYTPHILAVCDLMAHRIPISKWFIGHMDTMVLHVSTLFNRSEKSENKTEKLKGRFLIMEIRLQLNFWLKQD